MERDQLDQTVAVVVRRPGAQPFHQPVGEHAGVVLEIGIVGQLPGCGSR
jgi:hypothetical protein